MSMKCLTSILSIEKVNYLSRKILIAHNINAPVLKLFKHSETCILIANKQMPNFK